MHYDHYRFTTTQMKHVEQGSRKIVLEGYSSRNTNSAMGFNVLVQVFQDNPFDQGNPFFYLFLLHGTITSRVGLVLG